MVHAYPNKKVAVVHLTLTKVAIGKASIKQKVIGLFILEIYSIMPTRQKLST